MGGRRKRWEVGCEGKGERGGGEGAVTEDGEQVQREQRLKTFVYLALEGVYTLYQYLIYRMQRAICNEMADYKVVATEEPSEGHNDFSNL